MRFLASAGALAIVAASWGTAGAALTLAQAASPAETPPSGYSKDVYVDSRGCVYVRANIGSTVNWVPRLSGDRKTVVCGMAPTGATASVAATPPPPPAPPPPAAVLPVAATPAPATRMPAPIRTAAMPVHTAAAATHAVATGGVAPITRTMEVICPTDGSSARVKIGGDTVRVSCPAGMTRATSYIVTHPNGSRSRLVAKPAPTMAFGHGYDVAHSAPPADLLTGASYTTQRVAVPARPVQIPAGYRAAWDDDRLNPNRGPRTAYGDAQMATVLDTTKVPMRPAETAATRTVVVSKSQPAAAAPAQPAVATGARYVQVGAFGKAGNANKALARIGGLGMAGATARTGSGLTLVMAGPFASTAELQRALATLRGYFPDAYTRG